MGDVGSTGDSGASRWSKDRQSSRCVLGRCNTVNLCVAGNDIETIVHETVHYCVEYLFKNGFKPVAQEDLTRRITSEFLYSPAFQKYVKELKIGK